MIVDDKMITILRKLHSELPILSLDEFKECKKLIESTDVDNCAIGQSMLYFSNFFERIHSVDYLLNNCKNLTDDGKTLKTLANYIKSNDINKNDSQILKFLQDDNIR
jgi:hypothetical protein